MKNKSNEQVAETLERYEKHFDTVGFPFAMLGSASNDDLIRIMEDCIEKDEKYKPVYEKGIVY